MGVKHLWEFLRPIAQPVALESLGGMTLAIDVSQWLVKSISGMRDASGQPVPYAHLISLFHRICKLLFFGIKPIFVFDGTVPELKRKTIMKRKLRKAASVAKSQGLLKKVTRNKMKQFALSQVIGSKEASQTKQNTPQNQTDIFYLPHDVHKAKEELLRTADIDDIDSRIQTSHREMGDIDIDSETFKEFPLTVQYEVLAELKEDRKREVLRQSLSLPEVADDFSRFQMEKLYKQNQLTRQMRDVENQMAKREVSDASCLLSEDNVANLISCSEGLEGLRVIKNEADKISLLVPRSSDAAKTDTSSSVPDVLPVKFKETLNQTEPNQTNDTSSTTTCNPNPPDCSYVDRVESTGGQDEPDVLLPQRTTVESNIGVLNYNEKPQPINLNDEASDNNNIPNSNVVELSALSSATNFDGSTTEIRDTDGPDKIQLPINLDTVENEATSRNEISIQLDCEEDDDDNDFIEVPLDSCSPDDVDSVRLEHTENWLETHQVADEENPMLLDHGVSTPVLDEPGRSVVGDTDDDDVEELFHMDEQQILDEFVRLRQQTSDFDKERSRLERLNMNSLTELLHEEAQHLLRLFGIPFIVASGEAEAQCAVLEQRQIVDAVVTDDSDVFLFGGSKIYKNLFNTNREVELYSVDHINKYLHCDRSKLICFAMICGCDYTDGISGIGEVTALEILSEFSSAGSKDFQPLSDFAAFMRSEATPDSFSTKVKRSALRSRLRKFTIPPKFPDERIFQAFTQADAITANFPQFTWTRPDLDLLREEATKRFLWTKDKLDSLLLPVLERLNSRQLTIKNYFSVLVPPRSDENSIRLSSTRLQTAVAKLAPIKTSTKKTRKLSDNMKAKAFKAVSTKRTIEKKDHSKYRNDKSILKRSQKIDSRFQTSYW